MKSSRVMILLSLIVIIGSLALHSAIVSVLAQAALKLSDPASGALLDRSPVEVFAWFSEPIEPGSELKVFGSDFQTVTVGSTVIDANDVSLMRIELTTLPAGRYTVDWQVHSRDGSVDTGSFDFSVRDKPIEWMPIAAVGGIMLGGTAIFILGVVGVRRLRRSQRS